MSKESFKTFARMHPELAKTVLNGGATWQQLYEIYEIYGGENSVWNSYFSSSDSIASSFSNLKDLVGSFKNLDMDSLRQGIENIQKTVGFLQDIGFSKRPTYEAKPIYKRFEDS